MVDCTRSSYAVPCQPPRTHAHRSSAPRASFTRVSRGFPGALELNRRTFFIGWILLIPTSQTFLRLVVAIVLSIASLTLLLSVRPYRRAEENELAAGCQLTLVFGFIGACFIRLYEDLQELGVGEVVVQDAMVFTSTTAITSPLLTVNLGMVVLMLAIMVSIIVNEESLPAVRVCVHRGRQRWASNLGRSGTSS